MITNADFVVIIRSATLSLGTAIMVLLTFMLITFYWDWRHRRRLGGFRPVHVILGVYALFETIQDTTILLGRLDEGSPQTALLYPTLAAKVGLMVGLWLIFRETWRRLRADEQRADQAAAHLAAAVDP